MSVPQIPFHLRVPPAAWLIAAILGVGGGLGAFAFIYGRGHAYLTDDPRACMQCHVMKPQYDGWLKSPHRAVTTCNSCHAPRDFIGKYATKAINGFNHSLMFTTGGFLEPIRIKGWNRRIAEKNCIECHQSLWDSARSAHRKLENSVSCTHCHYQAGHPH